MSSADPGCRRFRARSSFLNWTLKSSCRSRSTFRTAWKCWLVHLDVSIWSATILISLGPWQFDIPHWSSQIFSTHPSPGCESIHNLTRPMLLIEAHWLDHSDKTTFQTLPLSSSAAFTSLRGVSPSDRCSSWESNPLRCEVTGGIGGFLELPQFSVNITQLSNVDQKCEQTASSPGILMGNFINIMPTIDLEVGVLAEVAIEAHQLSTQAVLASTQYALPTACVDFDAKAGTYSAANSTSSAGKTDNGPYLRGSYVVLITIISMGLACGWM